MHYRELTETIQNRPRNLGAYLTARLKTLAGIRADLAQAREQVKQFAKDGESMLSYCIRYVVPDDQKDAAREVYRLEYLNLDDNYQLEHLQQTLETYQKYRADRAHNFLKYVFSSMEYVRPVTAEDRTAMAMLRYAEPGFAEYGYTEHDPDPEYQAAKQLLDAYRRIAACLQPIERLQHDITTKLGVIRDIMASYDIDKYRPAHGEVETLYHATAYAPEIVREGFQAEPPDGRRGLGNFGHQNDISFTHDLEIARNIMRTLKEMWLIAHGQLTGDVIMRWARTEGISDAVRTSWRHLTDRPGPWTRAADPEDVAHLYRYWLAHTKLRADPMMTYPDKMVTMLKTRPGAAIGVLVCDVRLTPQDRYLLGEAEFRVAAERVVSVRRLF